MIKLVVFREIVKKRGGQPKKPEPGQEEEEDGAEEAEEEKPAEEKEEAEAEKDPKEKGLTVLGWCDWKCLIFFLFVLTLLLIIISPWIPRGWIIFLRSGVDIPWGGGGKSCPCGSSPAEALTSGRECQGSWSRSGKSWTWYLKDRKLRADWVGTGIGVADQPLHIIYRDLCFYRWTDEETATGMKLGTKKCFSSEGEWAEDAEQLVGGADFCDNSQPATVDDSLFEPPENVHWVDPVQL